MNASPQTEHIHLGPSTGNNGSLYVDGAGSSFNVTQGSKSEIDVGLYGGNGLLSVTGGGAVNIGVQGGLGLGELYVGLTEPSISRRVESMPLPVYNSGMLRVDGTLQALSTQSYGIVSGTGNITGNLAFSGTLAPGDSPGTLHTGSVNWNAGGVLKIAVNDADGTAGGTTGWSLLSISGNAELESIPHTISLESLTAGNQPGLVPDFDPTHNYSWTVLTANESVIGAAGFTVDTSSFENPLIGHFSVMADGSSLVVNYTVPEPSTFVLAGLGMIVAGCTRYRRRANR